MKDEILAAAAKRAQGRGWWDCVPATQTKICDLLTCSQSTTNIFSSIFTARDNNSSLSLSLFSVFFQLSSFLPIFVRLRSGWIILLAWQNYFVSSVFKTQFLSVSFPVLDYQMNFPIISQSLVLYRFFSSVHQRRIRLRSSAPIAAYNCCLYFLFLTSLYEVPTSRRDEDGLPPNERRLKWNSKI